VLLTSRCLKVIVAASGLLIAATSANIAALPEDDPLARLAGRWTGNAVMRPTSGPSVSFKCIVTYLPSKDGAGMKQNLRCKSQGARLEASTHLTVKDGKLSGRWEDRINSLDGTVRGDVTDDGFEILLGGRFFAAKMAVAGSACEQQVKVSPQRSGFFRDLSASLRKC